MRLTFKIFLQIIIGFQLLINTSFAQNNCADLVTKSRGFTHKIDSANIRLSLTIWGIVTHKDIAVNYQNWLPEQDFDCLVNSIKWKAKYPLILVVYRQQSKTSKKVVSSKSQVFDFDVFRALIYQK